MPFNLRLCALAAGLASTALLSGCAHRTPIGGDPELNVLTARELPVPNRRDVLSELRPYPVGPFDRLTIDVFGIEELSGREVQVDGSGRIAFPLVGTIEVAGLTQAEIQQLMTDRLREAFVRDPQVTVNLKEAVSQVVTVEGRVRRPGIYPITGRMTLLRALARAEGTDEYSDLQDVIIFRTVGGQRYAALYDVDAVRHGAYPDPEVFPNDLIMVGDDQSRRVFRDLLQTWSLVSGPLVIAIDRLAN